MLSALSASQHAPNKKRGKTCTWREARENMQVAVGVGKNTIFLLRVSTSLAKIKDNIYALTV